MSVIGSRDNPRVRRWTKLLTDASFRRSEKRVIVEGPHLVTEALHAGLPVALIVSETGMKRAEIQAMLEKGTGEPVVLADRLFGIVTDAETPQGIAAEIAIPEGNVDPEKPSVFLEGVQDPGNVGAILRSAAAFGVGEMVLDRACADAWSPKVLRAAMGGHFRLAIRQVAELGKALETFEGTTVCTVSNAGIPLREAELRGRLGWIFGAEGRGVSDPIVRRAAARVTIATAPGTQSINVAAAAAICLYEGYARDKK